MDIFGLVFKFLKDIKDIDGFDFTILTGTLLGFVVIDKLRVEILRIGLKSERISWQSRVQMWSGMKTEKVEEAKSRFRRNFHLAQIFSDNTRNLGTSRHTKAAKELLFKREHRIALLYISIFCFCFIDSHSLSKKNWFFTFKNILNFCS